MQIQKITCPQPNLRKFVIYNETHRDKNLFKVPKVLNNDTVNSLCSSPRGRSLRKRPGSTSPSMGCGSTLKKVATQFMDL